MKRFFAAICVLLTACTLLVFAACQKNADDPTTTTQTDAATSDKATTTTATTAGTTTVPFGETTSSALPDRTTGKDEETTLELTTVKNDDVTIPAEEKDRRVEEFWLADAETSDVKRVEDLGDGFSIYEITATTENGEKESSLLLIYFFKGKAYPVDGDSYTTAAERQTLLDSIRSDTKDYKKNLARVQTFSVMVWDTLYEGLLNGEYDLNDILGVMG